MFLLTLILIPELHGNLVTTKTKEFLSQTVALFFLPFLCQKLNDALCALKKSIPIAPDTGRGIPFRHTLRVLGVPLGLRKLKFLHSSLLSERRLDVRHV